VKLEAYIESGMTTDLDQIKDVELIKDIQFHLNRIGYKLAVDGALGNKTEAAWAKFKKDRYLNEPEKIGGSSARLLFNAQTSIGLYCLPTHCIGWVSSPFGPRALGFHKGIDIACNEGTAIYAVADGVITTAISTCRVGSYKCGGGYGNVVYIDHRGKPFEQTRYAHLERLAAGIDVGSAVKAGALLGYCGNTGHSFGPHLHFETRAAGIAKNPLDFFNPIV
jgi:murein DD-endopeptidase MepM/ murein hydrolase activator NlpD